MYATCSEINPFVTSGTYYVYVPHRKSLFKSAGITALHFFSMLPSTLKCLCMVLCAMLLYSIAHSIICTRLFRGKMHSYWFWFNGIEILQVRWQHGEKVRYFYPRGLEKDLSKWDIYVPLFTKGLIRFSNLLQARRRSLFPSDSLKCL